AGIPTCGKGPPPPARGDAGDAQGLLGGRPVSVLRADPRDQPERGRPLPFWMARPLEGPASRAPRPRGGGAVLRGGGAVCHRPGGPAPRGGLNALPRGERMAWTIPYPPPLSPNPVTVTTAGNFTASGTITNAPMDAALAAENVRISVSFNGTIAD